MQYHLNIEKEIGQDLYLHFVKTCDLAFMENSSSSEKGVTVKSGTFGNRQVLTIETNGPFTHIVEF